MCCGENFAYGGGSDMKLTELHKRRSLVFCTSLEYCWKQGGRVYAACNGGTRRGGEMSVGIPETRDRMEGLGLGRRIWKWITKK